MPFFLILFITLPIIEIFVLIQVGKQIGGLPTIALVIATAVVGVALLKRQGVRALASAREKMAKGVMPAREMADGVFLAFGGALLLTPGFITDAIGFCCLIPGLRHGLVLWLMRHAGPRVRVFRPGGSPPGSPPAADQGRTIEGQYRRED